MRILLVEDSPRLRELLIETIHKAEWRVDAVETVVDACAAVDVAPYDLMLVDLGLPDGDGLDLVRFLRRAGHTTPVLIMTARGAVDERIAGLDAGADDYLVKPFNHFELLARCRALLRRAPAHVADLIELGHIAFDPTTTVLSCSGETVALSPRERSVLAVLLRNAGSVVPKERIEAKLSEFGGELSANAIELAISRLRKRLDAIDAGITIETVRGAGYLLRDLTHD